MSKSYIVIGGGIIGLAVAYEIRQRYADAKITVIEKEKTVATHQSGRNSGVIHSGVYYKPVTLKARMCREGKKLLEKFCEDTGVPFQRVGKIIVATRDKEIPALERLEARAHEHSIECSMTRKIREIEPYAAGIMGLHIPETGIVEYREVCRALAYRINGAVRLSQEVVGINGNEITTNDGCKRKADTIINCAGLYADRIMRMCGLEPDIQIVPFRGEFYKLRPEVSDYVQGLIYPVPDPRLPFLGVHFTKMMSGEVECGPNAILALGREGYSKWHVNPRDLWEIVTFPGLYRMLARYYWTAAEELVSSLSRTHYLRRLQRLLPKIKADDLIPRVSGIRAQAMRRDGTLVDDFVIEKVGPWVHVLNAPSPAATACLSIAKHVVGMV